MSQESITKPKEYLKKNGESDRKDKIGGEKKGGGGDRRRESKKKKNLYNVIYLQ